MNRPEDPREPGRPLRLLYVVSLFPCWSETFIVREITHLVAAGADVQILSLKAAHETLVQPDAERLLGRVRHPLPRARAALARTRAFFRHRRELSRAVALLSRGLARKPLDLAKSLEALGRGLEHLDWVREFDPDIVHAHWATFPSTVAWVLGQVLNKPFGFTCHAHDIFANDHLLKTKIEGAKVAVTISRYNVEWLAAKVAPCARDRVHVVHCGVDLSSLPFRPDGREPGSIVAVGRLDDIKGFDVLVDALRDLARQGRLFSCRIIGAGPLERELRAQIDRQGLTGQVVLAGALPQAEVRSALYSASVFALPSVVTKTGDRDGIPVSLMEAMATGTPSVSTTVSGIPELIEHEREGLLVRARDVSALASAIGRLLDEPDLGRRFARAARAKVEREFDVAREAQKLLGLFSEASA
jgi:colanic acid/amylovoran biosynthesis glycosyltransferase